MHVWRVCCVKYGVYVLCVVYITFSVAVHDSRYLERDCNFRAFVAAVLRLRHAIVIAQQQQEQ